MKQLLTIVTGGEADRIRARRLTEGLQAEVTFYDIDRSLRRWMTARKIRKTLASKSWDLVYQEGSGIASGANLIYAAVTRGQPYIVSSGDPVGGFFNVTEGPVHGAFFSAYESLLYRSSAGFVGWTPYLTGVAMRLGARRAVTVEGAVDLELFRSLAPADRRAAKIRFGLDPDHLVCGVVGSLGWTPRQSYCYGLELVESLKRVKRADLSILIVGEGDGRSILESRVPEQFRSRVVFTGRLLHSEVVPAMNAMDIGFITQTLDQLGSFRLTTKLPEYLACGVPVAMSPIPGYYDYALEAGWSLPAFHPASAEFHERCAGWLDRLDRNEIREKSLRARDLARQRFDYAVVGERFRAFVHQLLDVH